MYKKLMLIIFLVIFSTNISYSQSEMSDKDIKVVHVLVALCDNFHQKIVPVPKNLGTGDDPENNLYWGAMYGIKTYFRNSADWIFIKEIKNPEPNILRRAIFKHNGSNTYMVADAYIGKMIHETISDFFNFSSGREAQDISTVYNNEDIRLRIKGGADLVAYVGHNGLMDFRLNDYPTKFQVRKKDVIVLACYSKSFFKAPLEEAGTVAVLWTNSKLAPEGYVLKAALDSWIKKEPPEEIRKSAAKAYAKYQKISEKSALRMFASEEREPDTKSFLNPEKNK